MKLDLNYTKTFLKSTKKLPNSRKQKLAYLLEIFQEQPFSPLLHTKPLTGELTGFYSFRITREYRVIFKFLDEITIQLVDVAHRKDIYR